MEKSELLYIAGCNVKWHSHFEKLAVPLKVKYDPAVPALQYVLTGYENIYTCTQMFIAAAFTTVRTWGKPNIHQLKNGLMKDVCSSIWQ